MCCAGRFSIILVTTCRGALDLQKAERANAQPFEPDS